MNTVTLGDNGIESIDRRRKRNEVLILIYDLRVDIFAKIPRLSLRQRSLAYIQYAGVASVLREAHNASFAIGAVSSRILSTLRSQISIMRYIVNAYRITF